MKRTTLMSATWVVALNAIVLLAHSVAHFGLHVLPMTLFDYLFIGIVIMILPLLALFMMYNTRLSRWGMWLLLLSLLSSLLYGLIYHFLLPGMDNVTNVGAEPWHLLFVITSYVQFPLQAAGVIVGIWALLSREQAQTQA
ncbi:hypothetical protein [Ktedonobacter sp. SOSP1-85]|uniref:hypothetical protein n=1 Tax=Ktedonobacter sp. SOSP1-85 TaxID=2778367 RepID=UPI001915D6AC|nr:hypothetical protein [Ktedonobacter sp. SOSP1-85]